MKAIFTGDWHFGRNHDSPTHNQYLIEFVEFMVEYANKNDIGVIYQTGDFFDNRSKISVETINYAIQAMKYVKDNFNGDFNVLVGNHDMYFKNRLDVSSSKILEPYCNLIEEFTLNIHDDTVVAVTPWICDQEDWDHVVNQSLDPKVEYIVGHFEFKNFKMNEGYTMEHGLSHRELRDCRRVITGHYHMRQEKGNVVYVGSPFPFDYNDANDVDRGFTVIDLETNEMEHVDWGKVKILSLSYEDFLEFNEEGLIDEHTSVRIDLPDDATDDDIKEATEVVSNLKTTSSKINYRGNKAKELLESEVDVEEVSDIDESIINSIRGIVDPPSDIDVDMLVDIFNKSKSRNEREYNSEETDA